MDELELKHVKRTIVTVLPDDTERIESESYYDELKHRKVELEKKNIVAGRDLLKIMMECSSALTDGQSETLTLSITRRAGNVYEIKKRWQVSNQKF